MECGSNYRKARFQSTKGDCAAEAGWSDAIFVRPRSGRTRSSAPPVERGSGGIPRFAGKRSEGGRRDAGMGRGAIVTVTAAEAKMRRGTIAWVNLSDASPPETGKIRPGLIVSNSDQNAILQTVVIVPLSTQSGEMWPLRLRIETAKKKPSFAVIPGIRQVSKARLLDTIAFATDHFLEQLSEALAAYLGD